MGLSIGIVGLPNVGKSTLFNALTKNKAEASNYPFCTIDPNTGIVPVPDERLSQLAKAVKTEKIIPAVVEFVDIAGIVEGASKGEGLGNKFLANIRECDAIVEVVRDFNDENVIHVAGDVNPKSDIETIKTELILADLETIQKKVFSLEKEYRGNPKIKPELDFSKRIQAALEAGESARDIKPGLEDESIWLKSFQLLSAKPHIYIYNTDESSKQQAASSKTNEVSINAKIESELADLSDEERDEYLEELGIDEPGLNVLIRRAYELLGLQSYFTAGEKEVRAWTIKKDSTAPKAAGVIHTDFEKGFIKAEIVSWKDLVDLDGWVGAREKGKVRLEGRDYIMKEGDVALFKFSS
jgi:ribosome-binding ATPase